MQKCHLTPLPPPPKRRKASVRGGSYISPGANVHVINGASGERRNTLKEEGGGGRVGVAQRSLDRVASRLIDSHRSRGSFREAKKVDRSGGHRGRRGTWNKVSRVSLSLTTLGPVEWPRLSWPLLPLNVDIISERTSDRQSV